MKKWYWFAGLAGLVLIGAVTLVWSVLRSPAPTPAEIPVVTPSATEQPVIEIPLSGPVAQANTEVSGIAWYGDFLILLPQYPDRMSDQEDGALLAIPRDDVLAFLDGEMDGPLGPVAVPLIAPDLAGDIRGFEGYEAIAFVGNRAFLTVEASPGRSMQGYLVMGTIAPDLSALRLDPETLVEIDPQADLSNMTDETVFTVGDMVVTIYEANGANVNPSSVAHQFDMTTLAPLDAVPFPTIEYRITDATTVDEAGIFWAINYFYPGDTKLDPAADPLAAAYGIGPTHAQCEAVERLVAFQYDAAGISLAARLTCGWPFERR